MKLYDWQEECLHAWEEHQYRGIAHVITGAGKTVMALHGILRLKDRLSRTTPPRPLRVRIVVPTCSLAAQWSLALQRLLPGESPIRPGRIGGGRTDSPDQDYTIYVINSARYQLARHILQDLKSGYDVLLIADECHHFASPENRKIFDFLPCIAKSERCYTLGLSATPHGYAFRSVLVPALGPVIYQYGFSQAASAGTVCSFSVFQIQLSFTAEELERYEDYSYRIVQAQKRLCKEYPHLKHLKGIHFFEAVRQLATAEDDDPEAPATQFLRCTMARQQLCYLAANRLSCVEALIHRISPTEKILVFSERISQAEALYTRLRPRYSTQLGLYHSQLGSASRRRTLEQFHSGHCRILICCRSLDEGVDVPDATIGIILSGTAVRRQHIQRLGRILRPAEGKTSACMYYLYLNESTEDCAFLPDTPDATFPICNLSYSGPGSTFSHPAYEAAAAGVLSRMRAADTATAAAREPEIRRCLEEGLIRPDWLLSPSECRTRQSLAVKRHEKNYWRCMEEMAKATGQAHS
ncbi:MAG: DEAD/DEAH box helicase [Eubacteriales bacterium]|nr:DEAD/DEAH box helicase [Eubacteriales bacterium]